jgi:hypothetical protein
MEGKYAFEPKPNLREWFGLEIHIFPEVSGRVSFISCMIVCRRFPNTSRSAPENGTEHNPSSLQTFETYLRISIFPGHHSTRSRTPNPQEIMIYDDPMCVRRAHLINHTIYLLYWVWFGWYCRKLHWFWRLGVAINLSFMTRIAIDDLHQVIPTVYEAYWQASVIGIYLVIQCLCILAFLTPWTLRLSTNRRELRELEERKASEEAATEMCTRLCPNCGVRIFKVEKTCRHMKCRLLVSQNGWGMGTDKSRSMQVSVLLELWRGLHICWVAGCHGT